MIAKEAIYWQLLLQLKPNELVLWPLRGAANTSFLYLLGRMLHEHRNLTLVEFGVGQSTILINYMIKGGKHYAVDDSEFWVNNVKGKLHCQKKTSLLIAPLREAKIKFIEENKLTYNVDEDFIQSINPDVVIIDGPKGSGRFSRSGILPLLYDWFVMKENCVAIFDDTHRRAERETVLLLIGELKKAGIEVLSREHHARKSQYVVIKGNKFSSIHYY